MELERQTLKALAPRRLLLALERCPLPQELNGMPCQRWRNVFHDRSWRSEADRLRWKDVLNNWRCCGTPSRRWRSISLRWSRRDAHRDRRLSGRHSWPGDAWLKEALKRCTRSLELCSTHRSTGAAWLTLAQERSTPLLEQVRHPCGCWFWVAHAGNGEMHSSVELERSTLQARRGVVYSWRWSGAIHHQSLAGWPFPPHL